MRAPSDREKVEQARSSQTRAPARPGATAPGPFGLLGTAGNHALQRLLRGDVTDATPAVGPRTTAQRVTVTTPGTAVHDGLVGGPGPGEVGVPIGSVQVRTGETIELAPGSTVPNVIALEYSGSLTADSRWLQFVWFELTAATPGGTARVAGSVPTTSGTKPFTTTPATPSWSVDSGTSNPFYEAGGAAIRTASATTMFDAPGGGSVAPLAAAVFASGVGATSATFTAHFDTYLIQRNRAAYRVQYSAATTLTPGARGASPVASAIGYSLGASGPVAALPANLRTILHTGFPTFTGVR